MALVNVHINGKEYALACDEGQEQHVFELSQELDSRMRQLSRQVGQAPEHMLLLMTALTLADEMSEAQKEARELERECTRLARELRDARMEIPAPPDVGALDAVLEEVAERIDRIAQQLEIR